MRIHKNSERIQKLVDSLVVMYIEFGSVNKICEKLNEFSETKIFSNRILAILNDNPNQSLNLKTIETIELAVSKVPKTELNENSVLRIKDKCATGSIRDVSNETGIPIAVLKYVSKSNDMSSVAIIRKMIDNFSHIEASLFVNHKDELLSLMEDLSVLTNKYIKMLKAIDG